MPCTAWARSFRGSATRKARRQQANRPIVSAAAVSGEKLDRNQFLRDSQRNRVFTRCRAHLDARIPEMHRDSRDADPECSGDFLITRPARQALKTLDLALSDWAVCNRCGRTDGNTIKWRIFRHFSVSRLARYNRQEITTARRVTFQIQNFFATTSRSVS